MRKTVETMRYLELNYEAQRTNYEKNGRICGIRPYYEKNGTQL